MNRVAAYSLFKHLFCGKFINLLGVLFALAIALSACGQRSDLVLPSDDEQEQTQSS